MRRYETIFILRPDQGESQIKDTIRRFEGFVTQGGGELIETDEWGSRELAYRIRGERRGYYVRLDYVSEGAVMNEVERNLKLMDESLRHLSVMVEDDADPVKLRGEIEARQRRLAEARAAAAPPRASVEEPPAAEEAAGKEAQSTSEGPTETPTEPAAEEPAEQAGTGNEDQS